MLSDTQRSVFAWSQVEARSQDRVMDFVIEVKSMIAREGTLILLWGRFGFHTLGGVHGARLHQLAPYRVPVRARRMGLTRTARKYSQ